MGTHKGMNGSGNASWALVASFAIFGASRSEPWDTGWHLFIPWTSSLHKQPLGSSVPDLLPKLETEAPGPKRFIGLPVRAAPGTGWKVQKATCSPMPLYYSIWK